jgi:Uma2 family endonuclease
MISRKTVKSRYSFPELEMAVNVIMPKFSTVADVLKLLGNVPASRIRWHPIPGTATEKDLIAAHDQEKRLCELVDGILVEKPVGAHESQLTLLLAHLLHSYLDQHRIGILLGPDGPLRIGKGLVRLPDISFISSKKLPGGKLPEHPIPDLVPDLAIEVLSKSNTPGEMKRKLREYFQGGVTLVWLIQPKNSTVRVHTAPAKSVLLSETDTLDGGTVLPGFSLPLRKLFNLGE